VKGVEVIQGNANQLWR